MREFERTGELLVELGSDQTSCHNPFGGGYYPVQLGYQEAQQVIYLLIQPIMHLLLLLPLLVLLVQFVLLLLLRLLPSSTSVHIAIFSTSVHVAPSPTSVHTAPSSTSVHAAPSTSSPSFSFSPVSSGASQGASQIPGVGAGESEEVE